MIPNTERWQFDEQISMLHLFGPNGGVQVHPGGRGTPGYNIGTHTSSIFIAASDAQPWELLAADYICSGVSDDIIIQKVINSLPVNTLGTQTYSQGGGGSIRFSSGHFSLSNTITCVTSNVTFVGAGQGNTIFTVPNNFNSTAFQIGGSSGIIWNVHFMDLQFNGNSTNQTSGYGWVYNNAVNCNLYRVTALNVFNYVVKYTVTGGKDSYNCWHDGVFFGGNCGGFIQSTGGETNIYMNSYYFGAVGFTGGAYPFAFNGGETFINNQCGGNSNTANQNAYIRVGNTNPVRIIGNNFNNCSKQWCQLLSGGHSVIGNTFVGGGQLTPNTYNAIEIWDGNNIITDNNFGAFTNYNNSYIVEKNSSGNGNVITDNGLRTGLPSPAIIALNPYTEVRGNTNFPDLQPVIAKNTNYTITLADYTIIASGVGTTITLPSATAGAGIIFIIKRVDTTNAITVNTTSSQTIDGNTSYTLSANYKYIQVQSDGSNWDIVANN